MERWCDGSEMKASKYITPEADKKIENTESRPGVSCLKQNIQKSKNPKAHMQLLSDKV